MSKLDTSAKAAGETSWWDRDEILADPWADPVERAAITLYELSYNTPEAVAGDMPTVKACAATAARWQRLPRPERHLYRRRAALVFEVGQRRPPGAR